MRAFTEHGLRRTALVAMLAALPILVPARVQSASAPKVENPHGALQEPCASCHDASGWKPARISRRFRHAKYGFPLAGAHAAADCRACHESLVFSHERTLCASCHQDPHRGEMGTDCARCHGARSFIDRSAMIRNHQLTRLPLTGSHATLDCESCHPPAAQGQMQFVGTRAECFACHEADSRSVTEPDHSKFSRDCTLCHTPLGWPRASFDHGRTRFPLTGAHRAAPCLGCHGDGVYSGKSTACVSCHRADYDGTTDPAHAGAGFSLSCASCHTTTSWSGVLFTAHDASYFPIYSGRHRGLWSGCATCHDVATDYSRFTCFSCHPHDDQAGTDAHHSGVSGYQYASAACYGCHPRGTH